LCVEDKYIQILNILEKEHAIPPQKRGRNPLDELIAVILSQNTSDNNSSLAYEDLFKRFSSYEEIAGSAEDEIARAIRRGGLANQKAKWIKRALLSVYEREGSYSLDFLRGLDDESAIEYLTSLDGVGFKSSRCVLLFSLGRDVFPVDTHVFRVSRRIGLVGAEIKSRERACEVLEAKVRPGHRYKLHMLLIYHGRAICKARKPGCEACSISHLCDYHTIPK